MASTGLLLSPLLLKLLGLKMQHCSSGTKVRGQNSDSGRPNVFTIHFFCQSESSSRTFYQNNNELIR